MKVDGVNVPVAHAYGRKAGLEAEEPPEEPAGGVTTDPATINPSPDELESEDNGQGALELLLAGHFKAVSAMRQAFHFQDELAAMEAEELKAAAEEQIDGVLESVTAGVVPLLGFGGDSVVQAGDASQAEPTSAAGIQEMFSQAVEQAKEEFLGAEAPSTDDLVADLSSAFKTFTGLLLELDTPVIDTPNQGPGTVDDEEVGEEEDVEEEEEESGSPESSYLQSCIANLEVSFAAAMEELISVLEGVSVLPPLAEPNGNGRSYDKFLAVYNELWGVWPAGEDSAEAVPLDLVV